MGGRYSVCGPSYAVCGWSNSVTGCSGRAASPSTGCGVVAAVAAGTGSPLPCVSAAHTEPGGSPGTGLSAEDEEDADSAVAT